MGIFWHQEKLDMTALREAAHLKRYMDLVRCDSAFRERAGAEPDLAAAEAGLTIRPGDARAIAAHPFAGPSEPLRAEPGSLLDDYLKEKREYRAEIRTEAGKLRHEGFASWHGRQVRRCDLELGKRVNAELMHLPAAFELSSGCSVGCPFCGLSAGQLKRVSRGDPETLKLFSELVRGLLELLGDGVRETILYYATEPLDTPDYPLFAAAFREICGRTPVVTTAVPLRNPERTRNILTADGEPERRIHRFSLLSEDIFRKCAETFSPEETLYVDFLPRYPEARMGMVQSGRAWTGASQAGQAGTTESFDGLMTDQGTIACVSGFIVNLAERTVRLATPCRADSQWPDGEMIRGPEAFSDAGEALALIEKMCGRMRTVPEEDEPLALQPFLRAGGEEPIPEACGGELLRLENPGFTRLSLEGRAAEICRMLTEKPAGAAEIRQRLAERSAGGADMLETQLTLTGLFRKGILIHGDGFEK